MPWTKAAFVIVILSGGFQYGLLFSKFSRAGLETTDIVILIASTVALVAAAYAILFRR